MKEMNCWRRYWIAIWIKKFKPRKETRVGNANWLIVVSIIFLILISNCDTSYGDNNQDIKDNVYMIIMNKLTLSDLEKMPILQGVIEDGSFGLMNTRGINGYIGAESFITINASNKAFANEDSSQFYHLDEKYKRDYKKKVAIDSKECEIGNIHMGKLSILNEGNTFSAHLGLLGDIMHDGGLKTAIFGNSDTDDRKIRTSALIPMDSRGLVDYGNINDTNLEDIDFPCGIMSDYKRLLDGINHIKTRASLIVIDTGDLNRLSKCGNVLIDDIFFHKRSIILKRLDGFIEDLIDTIDGNRALLLIVSPNSSEERVEVSRLSPIILWGRGISKGLVISSTTNRKGIVSNMDLLPTIADFFSLKAEKATGSIIRHIDQTHTFDYIKTMSNRINFVSRVRTDSLLIYGVLGIIIMLTILILFILRINILGRMRKRIRITLLLLYIFPLIFIISPVLIIDDAFKYILTLTLLVGLSIYVFNYDFQSNIIYLITYAYYVLITIDILSNGYFSKYSIMGHDPIIGARYFGIGNEMVGLFLVITALTVGLLYEKINGRLAIILILLTSIFLIGYPKLGANVGGTIALIFASCYFILDGLDDRLIHKHLLFYIVCAGLILGFLILIDIKINPHPTHLGRTILSLKGNGLDLIKNLVHRKLLMNIKLVGASIWTKVLVINMLLQMVMMVYMEDRVIRIMDNGIGKGIISSIVGVSIGLLINDSGLLLAGIAINLVTIFMVYIIIDIREVDMQ